MYTTKAMETAKAVHTEHTPNNAHVDEMTILDQAAQCMSMFVAYASG